MQGVAFLVGIAQVRHLQVDSAALLHKQALLGAEAGRLVVVDVEVADHAGVHAGARVDAGATVGQGGGFQQIAIGGAGGVYGLGLGVGQQGEGEGVAGVVVAQLA